MAQQSSPTPIMQPVANANPAIPEDLNFWSAYDLHAIRYYQGGTLTFANTIPGMMKSMILGDTNFWLRGKGDPYLTNFDKINSGFGEEASVIVTQHADDSQPPKDCRTCVEVSGTIDSSFLDNFKQAVPTSASYPIHDSFDYRDFYFSSSRIEAYGNRVPLSDSEMDVLTIDRIVYMNGVATRLLMAGTQNTESGRETWNHPDFTPNGMGVQTQHHYSFERIGGTLRPNAIEAEGGMNGTLQFYGYGQHLPALPYTYNNYPSYIYKNSGWYDYLGSNSAEGVFGRSQTVGYQLMYNNVLAFRSQSSGGGGVIHNPALLSPPETLGSSGSFDSLTHLKNKLFKSIWYIENTQSFNNVFHNGSAGNDKGLWPGAPLYFMTSSSATTRAAGDWMPTGSRTKAYSLALALNMYGQFWGRSDSSNTTVGDLDYNNNSGSQGTYLKKYNYAKAPYSWSTDSNDNLIYTSSLCSGSRIDHVHTGYIAYAVGHTSGSPSPGNWFGSGSNNVWAQHNPLGSGSFAWPGPRGYTTYSGVDQPYLAGQGLNNFSESINGVRFNHEKGFRYDWNTWKILGDTGVSASFMITNSRDGLAPHPMYTGETSSSADKAQYSIGFITGSRSGSTGPEHIGLRFEKEWNQGALRSASAFQHNWLFKGGQNYGPQIWKHSFSGGLGDLFTNSQIFEDTISGALYGSIGLYRGVGCTGGGNYGNVSTHIGSTASPQGSQGSTPNDVYLNLQSDGGDPDWYRYTTWADVHQRYTKRSTCTCTEVFKWRGFVPVYNDEIFDLEFSDGYKFSTMGFTRLFMYNPLFQNQGSPVGNIASSADWPHSLRAITPHELYHFTGSAYVTSTYNSASVATYKLNSSTAFIKCADIIPGTTRTNGYVYLKDITKRQVRVAVPTHRNRYNSLQDDDKFNMIENDTDCIETGNISLTGMGVNSDSLKVTSSAFATAVPDYYITSSGYGSGFVDANAQAWQGWFVTSQSVSGQGYVFQAHALGNNEIEFVERTTGAQMALSSSGGTLTYTYKNIHVDVSQGSQLTPFTYAATTQYPRNHWGARYSSSIIYDGVLMLENGLYVGFEGPNCWTFDEYNLEARNPQNRPAGEIADATHIFGRGEYTNPLQFPYDSQRNL